MKKFLILGFGRMGITHMAHINGYFNGNCHFDIYDPSLIFRLASYFKIRNNIKFIRRLPAAHMYDAVIITSPPKAHAGNFRDCIVLSDSFFVEKPLLLEKDEIDKALRQGKKIFCGYVLRKNPCIQYMEKLINGTIDAIKVSVSSNLGLNIGEDWRFDIKKGGGCINELGSHAINIALYFADAAPGDARDALKVQSLSVGKFSVEFGGLQSVSVIGDWDVDVRKTTYSLTLLSAGNTYHTDFQSIWGSVGGEEFSWSPREEALDVSYYLRGVDFALQNKCFLESRFSVKDVRDAEATDKILQEILSYA